MSRDGRSEALISWRKFVVQVSLVFLVSALLLRWSIHATNDYLRAAMRLPSGACLLFGPLAVTECVRNYVVLKTFDKNHIRPTDERTSGNPTSAHARSH